MLTKPIISKQPPKTFAGLLLASLTDQSQAEAGVKTIIDPKTRGTVMHAWFECIEWRDDVTSKPAVCTMALSWKNIALQSPNASLS